jgi:hypothetical protein
MLKGIEKRIKNDAFLKSTFRLLLKIMLWTAHSEKVAKKYFEYVKNKRKLQYNLGGF